MPTFQFQHDSESDMSCQQVRQLCLKIMSQILFLGQLNLEIEYKYRKNKRKFAIVQMFLILILVDVSLQRSLSNLNFNLEDDAAVYFIEQFFQKVFQHEYRQHYDLIS